MQMSHPAGRKTKSAPGVKSDKVGNIYIDYDESQNLLYPVDVLGLDTISLIKCFSYYFFI